MKIFAISGLGADERVFNYIDLETELIAVKWIKQLKGEELSEYAKRLIKTYRIKTEDIILGVSFGGLVAVEISKILKIKTILISSVETKNELPLMYRFFGKTTICNYLPKRMYLPPRIIANYIFGAKNKNLLHKILDDTDLGFTKWAVNELINWNNEIKISIILKINGTKDKLIPVKLIQNATKIKDGEHFMIVDKANEINRLINHWIRNNFENR